MRLTVVGCAGSAPGPASSASCYLVDEDGFRLLLEQGPDAFAGSTDGGEAPAEDAEAHAQETETRA